jgi:hypothetical protein
MFDASEIITNVGNLIPSIYYFLRALFGAIGFVTAFSGFRILIAKDAQVKGSKSKGVWLFIFGSLMFSNGQLVETGSLDITGSYIDYSKLESFDTSESDDTQSLTLILIAYIIRLYSFVLGFMSLMTASNGVKYEDRGWVTKSILIYVMSLITLAISVFANAIGELFGYSTIGTDYFSI